MTTISDLMGLGMGPFLSRRLGVSAFNVTAAGTSLGSATALLPHNQIAYVISTNSGSGLKLPNIGGDPNGCTLSDMVMVFNFLGAAIQVYASNSCTITGSGASASGNTGVTVATCNACMFYPVTVSSWVYVKAGSA